MLEISRNIRIPESEVEISPIRAQGAGGQKVNKVSTAVHLRFDIRSSSLPDVYKQHLLDLRDRRISKDGVIVIKAQRFRSQDKNREDALERLRTLIRAAASVPRQRVPTRPGKRSKEKRVDQKVKRGRLKDLRAKIDY